MKKITLTTNQKRYDHALRTQKPTTIVLGVGEAGTGKTYLAARVGMEQLLAKQIKKMVIMRPAINVSGENHGYLPGDKQEKMMPYLLPIYDCFADYVTPPQLQALIKNGSLEICPFSFIRGRTFNDCYVLADETQNTTISQMKALLTRVGQDCRLVLNGDPGQSDLPMNQLNGLNDLIQRIDERFHHSDESCFDVVRFDRTDVMRSDVVKEVLSMYER